MINLGVIDLILIVLFVFMIYFAARRRALGPAMLIGVLLLTVALERLAPGTLETIGNSLRGIDQLNAAGPHLELQPIVRY